MTTLCSEELLCITPAAQLLTAAHHHFSKYEHYASFNKKKKTRGSFTFRCLFVMWFQTPSHERQDCK